MAIGMEKLWRTQYKIEDYGSRYETGAAPVRTPVETRMEQESQEARQEREYRRQANDPSTFLPAYLNQGLFEDLSLLRTRASNGDLTGAQEVRDKISKVADDYRPALVAWTQQGARGGEFGKTMATRADAILQETYLDQVQVNSGTGVMSARDFFANNTPEAKATAADVTAKKYGITNEAATILSDKDSPFHSVFSSMLDDLASGEKLQLAKATRMEGDDKVSQARSALQLYSEHLAKGVATGSWEDLNRVGIEHFYTNAYQYFGAELSTAQLDTLQRQYLRDMSDPNFNAKRWFQARRSSLDKNMPKELRPVPTADGKVRLEQIDAPGVDRYQVLDASLHTADLLNGVNVAATTDTVETATGVWFARQAQLENDLDIKFSDFGYTGAAAKAAAHNLSDDYVAEGSEHMLLEQTQNFVDMARRAFGYNDRLPTDSGAVLGSISNDLVKAATEAYLANRSNMVGGRFTDDSGALDAGFVESVLRPGIAAALKESCHDRAIAVDDNFVNAFANKYVQNMAAGSPQNMQLMLLDLAGRLGTTEDGRLTLQPPAKYIDPRSGVEVEGNIAPSADPGFMTLEAERLEKSSANAVNYGRARQEIQALADGKAPYETGRPEESAVKDLAAGVLKAQDQTFARGFHQLENNDVKSLRQPAGEVYLANLRMAGVEVPKGVAEFVDSGELFEFLEGDDKWFGVHYGSDFLRERMARVVNALADTLVDPAFASASNSTKQWVGGMFARLSMEAANRESQTYHRFSVTTDRLLQDSGVESFQAASPHILGSDGRRNFALDDAQADKEYDKLKRVLSLKLGVDLFDSTIFSNTGYLFPTDIGRKGHFLDYGKILSAWDAYARPEPPLAKTVTDAQLTSMPSEPVIADPQANIRSQADLLLRRSLSRDEGLNYAHARLNALVTRDITDPEMAKAMSQQLAAELDRKYDRGGFTAAIDWLQKQESTQYMYLAHAVTNPDGTPSIGDDGRPMMTTAGRWYTLDDLEAYKQRGWTDKALLEESSRNQALDIMRQRTMENLYQREQQIEFQKELKEWEWANKPD